MIFVTDRVKVIWRRLFCVLIGSAFMWRFFFSLNPMISSREWELFEELNDKIHSVLEKNPDRAKHIFLRISWVYSYNVKNLTLTGVKKHLLRETLVSLKHTYIDPLENEWLRKDGSVTQFVTNWVWYISPTYVPKSLILLQPSKTIEFKEEWEYYIHPEAYIPFQEMAQAYYDQFWEWFLVTSTWRSYEMQRDDFDSECKESGICAHAWYSEHQSGLAVDLARMVWRWYEWMTQNAHKYGFHQSYQKWKEIDRYQREDRHWRYVWVDLATELFTNKQTFTERYMLHSLVQQVAKEL